MYSAIRESVELGEPNRWTMVVDGVRSPSYDRFGFFINKHGKMKPTPYFDYNVYDKLIVELGRRPRQLPEASL